MTRFYDARGNIYIVVAPDAVRDSGIDLPEQADYAAQTRETLGVGGHRGVLWLGTRHSATGRRTTVVTVCWSARFNRSRRYDLLIVNTDGTLAERSGNGLTIFSQALSEQGLMPMEDGCLLRVHHDKTDAVSPGETSVKPAEVDGVQGFWLDLGKPSLGPQAVGAQGVESVLLNGREVSHVRPLSALEPAWNRSQFVRIGNPHCVTLVASAAALPSNEQMRESPLAEGLMRIAYAMPTGAGRAVSGGGQCAVGDA